MAAHTASGSTPNISNLSISPFNHQNHIDLTLDDDETASSAANIFHSPMQIRRPRTELPPPPHNQSMFYDPIHSARHSSAIPSHVQKYPLQSHPTSIYPQTPMNHSLPPLSPQHPHNYLPNIISPGYRPPFASQQSPTRSSSAQLPIASSSRTLPPLAPKRPPSSPSSAHQVIDLTGSPSPPPSPRSRQLTIAPLSNDLPPKTPVCIGQLTVTALVLYPVSYLQAQDPITPEAEWANVRLQYEHNSLKVGATETIHIKAPHGKGPTGEITQGEAFAVVEQKVASNLGPMLGKGLIRLDAKVRRGLPNLPILPLQMLVYTPKGNIPVVGSYLQQCGLYLDHPSPSYDVNRRGNYHYCNPHNPPPGGHRPSQSNRPGYAGPGGMSSRWNTPAISGKTLEVQRSQVDELFKSLKGGDELSQTEPALEVGTPLYPHQKKALTFLLEREREQTCSDGRYSSLWQARTSSLSLQPSWFHIVTQKEVFREPQEAKGAILADDMGLGKTITCVSLIAATLDSAQAFASSPLDPIPPPPDRGFQDSLSAAHFAGSVWGMPEPSDSAYSAKGKAKASKAQDKVEADYARACRIKAKSRATLIICPLSTVSNWEDQFREHWRGEVTVVGGGGMSCSAANFSSQQQPAGQPILQSFAAQASQNAESKPPRLREGKPLRVYVYHGNARRPDSAFLADFDAVITTYATLASEYSKQSRSIANADAEEDDDSSDGGYGGIDIDERGNQVLRLPKPNRAGMKRKKSCSNFPSANEATSALQTIHWFRVVLDEAHSIKETGTVGSRASCDLVADRRLCLTGTPVQNKLDDVFALIKFLRLDPFDDKNIWTEFIGTPVKYGQSLGVARLQTIMKCITLRRTKESKTQDGQRILHLPPRRDELRYLKFDPHEQSVYDQFFTESKAEFNELSTKNEVMKNYVGILQKILRLRQICDHFELVQGKGPGDNQALDFTSYEDITAAIEREGINPVRAAAIVALLREAATTQCVECGEELCTSVDMQHIDHGNGADLDGPPAAKRGRKTKGSTSRGPTRANSPSTPQLVLTKCQHLFCLECYRQCICPGWPDVLPDTRRSCSACQTGLGPQDAVQVRSDCMPSDYVPKKKAPKREKRVKGGSLENFHPSTKIKALLTDLIQFSKANPHSVNYDPSSIEVEMVDDQGNRVDDGVVKTVVFSQWTTMLDKIEDALEAVGIRYDRLDGTMKRDDRTRAMDALKRDPGCEVLLVSLKAGGVGLNLTAAQRVYLMDPYWNPAVENQAVDRIHRLGQTRPVTTVKLIIENSIEARLLEVQRKKTELANMTLGQNFSKADMLQRRMEELNQLFG
ncbi:SNF2 family N-terminal domain-containing protein [Hygrophoropsis aurantiaca]|uniref:SNF2 family N-terminal domain-containing protein n=1 Tax=Hygrophoropsis aurantiaca TaxID=72124 RepID=A0ACB8AD21_9AGAM|nr:SNF2 family N-terminal domain-containing protein [Hygrophoropsis aurantiaca]